MSPAELSSRERAELAALVAARLATVEQNVERLADLARRWGMSTLRRSMINAAQGQADMLRALYDKLAMGEPSPEYDKLAPLDPRD